MLIHVWFATLQPCRWCVVTVEKIELHLMAILLVPIHTLSFHYSQKVPITCLPFNAPSFHAYTNVIKQGESWEGSFWLALDYQMTWTDDTQLGMESGEGKRLPRTVKYIQVFWLVGCCDWVDQWRKQDSKIKCMRIYLHYKECVQERIILAKYLRDL